MNRNKIFQANIKTMEEYNKLVKMLSLVSKGAPKNPLTLHFGFDGILLTNKQKDSDKEVFTGFLKNQIFNSYFLGRNLQKRFPSQARRTETASSQDLK